MLFLCDLVYVCFQSCCVYEGTTLRLKLADIGLLHLLRYYQMFSRMVFVLAMKAKTQIET